MLLQSTEAPRSLHILHSLKDFGFIGRGKCRYTFVSVIWLARVLLVIGGSGLFFVLMSYRSSGLPSVKMLWEDPESQNTLTFFFLPGMLQNKKGGGSFGFVMRVSPAVVFLALP